jgi:hypothetical protein
VKAFRAATLTEMHAGLCDFLVLSPAEELDMVTSVDVQKHNVMAEAARMDWGFDLKDMWLTKQRWSMMCRQYLDPVTLIEWLNRSAQLIGPGGRGISLMRTNVVKPRGGTRHGNKETRRWGSCMLAVSYKAMPTQQITLYSRTSYLGYLGAMDLTVAWMCGRYLAEIMQQNVEDWRFVWMNEAIQYHHFKSLAFLLNHTDKKKKKMYRRLLMKLDDQLEAEDKELLQSAPALMYSRRWLQKVIREDSEGRTLGDINYNTYRRIVRRFHTEVMGYDYALKYEGWNYYKQGPQAGEKRDFYKAYTELPSVPAYDLDFTPLGLPSLDRIGTQDYDADAASQMEDDDDGE